MNYIKIFFGYLIGISFVHAGGMQACQQLSRFPHSSYQKGQLLCLIKEAGEYKIAKKLNSCNCCDKDKLYVVEHYSEVTHDDGTIHKMLTVSKDSDIVLLGFPLFKHTITLEEIVTIDGLKHGPGGPVARSEEQIRPHNGGTAIATILVVGIGGIIYKMLKKIKELQEQTKPTNA
jgi:hypothetical protein